MYYNTKCQRMNDTVYIRIMVNNALFMEKFRIKLYWELQPYDTDPVGERGGGAPPLIIFAT